MSQGTLNFTADWWTIVSEYLWSGWDPKGMAALRLVDHEADHMIRENTLFEPYWIWLSQRDTLGGRLRTPVWSSMFLTVITRRFRRTEERYRIVLQQRPTFEDNLLAFIVESYAILQQTPPVADESPVSLGIAYSLTLQRQSSSATTEWNHLRAQSIHATAARAWFSTYTRVRQWIDFRSVQAEIIFLTARAAALKLSVRAVIIVLDKNTQQMATIRRGMIPITDALEKFERWQRSADIQALIAIQQKQRTLNQKHKDDFANLRYMTLRLPRLRIKADLLSRLINTM
jgi:hypothetical protein